MTKRAIVIGMFLLLTVPPCVSTAILLRDIDNSGTIDLKDAVISLQISAGLKAEVPIYMSAEVSWDGKIGIGEALFVLQTLSGLRHVIEEPSITWTPKAAMRIPRTEFGVAAVNGTLYAIGGYSGSVLRSVEEIAVNRSQTK